MKFSTAFTGIISAFLVGATTAQNDEPNIVGGEAVPAGTYPWYVIPNVPYAYCGGSLISDEWVLSAAQCYDPSQPGLWNSVRIGAEQISSTGDVTRAVATRIIHPNYNSGAAEENDIMLLKLSEPINTKGIAPVPYEKSSSTSTPAIGTVLTAIGFGATSDGGSNSNVLRRVDLNKISQGDCNAAYSGDVNEAQMICAAVPGGGKDACTGDSGGPLIDKSTGVLVGVISWGAGCASAVYPGVYARVGNYASWIESQIGQSTKASSRRRLQSTAGEAFQPGDEKYQKFLEACGHFEYPLFLHVDKHSHLMVYGVPPEQAVAAGCPFGAAHSVFTHNEDGKQVAEKEILMWSDVEEGLAMFKDEESLPIGTFKLTDLAQAHEATPDEDIDGKSGVYDLVTNNCATYMVKMASTLGIKIDSHITSFVARRLVEESGKDLADKIRGSVHYFSSFLGGRRNLRASEEPTDQELVEALVNKGAFGAFSA